MADEAHLEMHDLEWVLVVGFCMAFFTAMGIGANDVANAFATSVGSGAISYKGAVVLASIFEFSGAVFLGGGVTKTIRKGIADLSAFCTSPEDLLVGMLCVVLCTGLWLFLATYFELPVSTTHSCVGGVIGIAVAAQGWGAVHWGYPGVLKIAMSWIVSPLVSGSIAAALFTVVRSQVLRTSTSTENALKLFPLLVWFTVALNSLMIMTHSHFFDFVPLIVACILSPVLGGIAAALVQVLYIPKLREEALGNSEGREKDMVENDDETTNTDKAADDETTNTEKAADDEAATDVDQTQVDQSSAEKTENPLAQKNDALVSAAVENDENIARMRANAEKFEPQTETVFSNIQVLTAMFMSLSHGSNDVANSIGPYAAIIAIYSVCNDFHTDDWCTSSFGPSTYDHLQDACVCNEGYTFNNRTDAPYFTFDFEDETGTEEFQYWDDAAAKCGDYDDEVDTFGSPADGAKCVPSSHINGRTSTPVLCVSGNAPVPKWIFVMGGAGIVLGLVLFGRKILMAMGIKMTKITPSRGFCIEISAAFVVTMGSFLGLPLSTTHCQVGATVGVGLCEGKNAVNTQMIYKIMVGWVITLAVTGVSSGLLYLVMAAILH